MLLSISLGRSPHIALPLRSLSFFLSFKTSNRTSKSKNNGRCTSFVFLDSIFTHLHDAVVGLVSSKTVIDFEKDVARNQAGAVFGDPDSSKVELSTQVFGHDLVEEVSCFDCEVLQDRAQVIELLDCKGSGGTLAVDEGLAERLVAVKCCLIGGETLADGGDVAGLFESSGDEA